MPVQNPIPPLFPDSLQDQCLGGLLQQLVHAGRLIEARARVEMDDASSSSFGPDYEHFCASTYRYDRRRSSFMNDISDYLDSTLLTTSRRGSMTSSSLRDKSESASSFMRAKTFTSGVRACRQYLVKQLSSHLLDQLMNATLRKEDWSQAGHLFCFTVLANQRLNKLSANHHEDDGHDIAPAQTDESSPNEEATNQWSTYLLSPVGSDLFLACLGQLSGLATLTLHEVCTNEMLYTIADNCSRLQVLDISFSWQVSDLGLVYLCGSGNANPYAVSNKTSSSMGCKYLRELLFNPQAPEDKPVKPIMSKVVAYLLKHFSFLEVVDLQHLHEGIEFYYRGSAGSYHPSPDRIPPLKLVHYTGSDKLSEVMPICPKLRTFKLFVTEALPSLGATLQSLGNSLDHVTLVYNHSGILSGLPEFLQACGERISSLEIDCASDTRIALSDLQAIAQNCKFLDILCFTSFNLSTPVMLEEPLQPLRLPFLTELRLSGISVERSGKEVFKHLLGGCPDIEKLYLSFPETAFFFSDFLLDDLFALNPLARLEQCILRNVSLTLISALRLISSRPKLRTIGRLLQWDVEPSELLTFAQILRRANSMKLLQDISIV